MFKKGLLVVLLLALSGVLFVKYKAPLASFFGDTMADLNAPKPTMKAAFNVDLKIRDELLPLLRDKRFVDLDARIEKEAVRFDSGELNAMDLSYVIDSLALEDPTLEPLLLEWVSQTDSWSSKLVASRYLDIISWQWRGGAYAHLVPDYNMKKYKALQDRARELHSAARHNSARDELWYSDLINFANENSEISEQGFIDEALEKYPQSATIYEAAIRVQHKKWGGDEFKRQDYIHSVSEILDGVNHRSGATSYYYEALAAADDKNYTTAVTALKKAISKNPNRVIYYSLLSKYYRKLDNSKDALRAIDMVLEYWPYSRKALIARAKIYADLGKLELAERDINLLLKYSPYHRNGSLIALRIYAQKGNHDAVMKTFERANYFTKHDANHWIKLGYQARYNVKNVELAKQYYSEAIGINPLDSGGHYNMATLYGDQESCELVDHLYKYFQGCATGSGNTKYWCAARYKNWAYGAVNYLKDHQKCPDVNDYNFSVF